MPVDFSLLQPVDVMGAYNSGLQQGRETRRQQVEQSALSAYAADPTSRGALSQLVQVNPQLGLGLMKQQHDVEKEQAVRRLLSGGSYADTPGAVNGTTAAGAAPASASPASRHPTFQAMVAAGVDPDTAAKIDDHHIEGIKRSSDFLGQAALNISTANEADRPRMWQDYVRQASSLGIQVPPEFQAYSPAALNAAAAAGKQVKDIIDLHAPNYVVAPPGGGLLNNNPLSPGFNPHAVANGGSSSLPRPRSERELDALPPGSQWIAPDGSLRTKGGASPVAGGATFP